MKKVVAALLGVAFVIAGGTVPASAQTSGNQRFTVIVQGDSDGRVIASGPITGVGQFQEGATEDDIVFVFPQGSLFLHVPNDAETEDFNETACFGTFTFTGPWTITSGTGAFAGASGSGRFDGKGTFVGRRTSEGCSEDGGFFFLIAQVRGTITLPNQAAA